MVGVGAFAALGMALASIIKTASQRRQSCVPQIRAARGWRRGRATISIDIGPAFLPVLLAFDLRDAFPADPKQIGHSAADGDAVGAHDLDRLAGGRSQIQLPTRPAGSWLANTRRIDPVVLRATTNRLGPLVVAEKPRSVCNPFRNMTVLSDRVAAHGRAHFVTALGRHHDAPGAEPLPSA